MRALFLLLLLCSTAGAEEIEPPLSLEMRPPLPLDQELLALQNDEAAICDANLKALSKRGAPWIKLTLLAATPLLLIWAGKGRRRALSPPSKRARDAFNALKREKLIEKGDYPRFCQLAAEIPRLYLKERYERESAAFTSEELLAALSPADRALLRPPLQRIDRARFAPHTPTTDECHTIMRALETLLQTKGPTPVP